MKAIEKIEFYLDGNSKKIPENEDKKELLISLGKIMTSRELSELFPEEVKLPDTKIFALMDSKNATYLAYIHTDITDLKKLFKIACPLFYNCVSLKDDSQNVDNMIVFAITKEEFDNTDIKSLGMDFNSEMIEKVKSGFFSDEWFVKGYNRINSDKLNDAQKIVLDYLITEASFDINYKENSLTFDKIMQKNKLRINNLNVLNLNYIYNFEINYDEDNNQYDIKDYDIIPFDAFNNEKSITNTILN